LVTLLPEPTISPILLLVTVLAEWNCNILNIVFSVGRFIDVGIFTSFLFYLDFNVYCLWFLKAIFCEEKVWTGI